MDLEQYKKDAIRTESQIDEIKVNAKMLINVLALYISAGQMLDQVKKRVFYGKEYDGDNFNHAYLTIRDAVEDIAGVPLSGELYEDTVDFDPRVFHAIVGIATESTELCEALYDTLLCRKEMDIVNLLEESFDVDWYQFILMDALGGDLEETWKTGIAKLKKRYPEKFTNENAINRDIESERQILEDGFKKD
jgi:hypothetical protein